MFCSKCGRQQAENAVFCSSCGAPLPKQGEAAPQSAGVQQTPQNTVPPPNIPPAPAATNMPPTPPAPAVNRPPAPSGPPRKSNTRFYIFLGVAVVVLIGIAVTLFIILPQSRQASATLPSASPAGTASASATPIPADTAATLRVYAAPTFDTGTSIASVLTGKTWVLAGVAHNPDQTYGEEGQLNLDDFTGNTVRLEFSGNTLTINENTAADGAAPQKLDYTVSDQNFCETTHGQDKYMRFYLGKDGNLYRTYMEGNDACSDYTVFTPSS
ncbi:MAG: zinc-ribbon domain-containing protein [Bacillota bacterium]